RGDGRPARAARRDRPRRGRRPVLRPRPIVRDQGPPGTRPLQRAIPRHRHPAPPMDSLRTADRGHVPGLTRQVQAGLTDGVAALYSDLPQKMARSSATVSRFAAGDTDPSDGPTPLIEVSTGPVFK